MFIHKVAQLNKVPSFKAGKTIVYTDFDNTYTPFSHGEMCDESALAQGSKRRIDFNNYFNSIRKFKDIAKEKLELAVTTGRNSSEYIFVEKALKNKNMDYLSPHYLITRDGGDKFIKKEDCWIKDEEKTLKLQQESRNWNSQKIKSALKNIIDKQCNSVLFLESGVNRCHNEYEGISLEDELNKSDSPNKEFYVSFVKNEDSVVEAAFSNKLPVKEIKRQIEEFIKENNINAQVNYYPKDEFCYCPQLVDGKIEYAPGNKIVIKPKIKNQVISKLYDVKESVKNIVNNGTNDLVIAAGDEINDEEMLNILNYLDIFDIDINKNVPLEETLERQDVLLAIQKLPLNIIVVGNSASLNHIREMDKILKSKGIDKIDCINNSLEGNNAFLKSIKKAIFNYAEQNDEYSYNIPIEMYIDLLDGGTKWS